MRVAIIGVGEVGGCYARAVAPSADVSLCDVKTDGPPAVTAEAIGVALEQAPGPWLDNADLVLVCVPGKESPAVAEDALAFVNSEAVYLDMSTARPDDLRRWSARFTDARRNFVDAAIMGSVLLMAEATSVLLAGENTDEAEAFYKALGAPVRIVSGGVAGDATSLKLLRSVFIKGLECLAIEALTAAEHMGMRGQLIELLADLDETPLADFLEMLVTTHIPHAARRRHEMTEASGQLRAMGFDALVTASLPKRYDATLLAKQDRAPAEGVRPMEESLAWLMGSVRR